MLKPSAIIPVLACVLFVSTNDVDGADWTRFRGPNGSGISSDTPLPPTKWSDEENLKWKAELPGPGLSSPIVIGDRVVVTCWSGYAADGPDAGSLEQLKRNVVCLNRDRGEILWSKTIDAVQPEDSFRGMFAENGYASHSPTSDGERVFVFFGKSGIAAFDLISGDQLWHTGVGERLESKGWGSASSPIIHEGLVIVPAFIEGDALVALDAETGAVAWKQEAPGYRSNWSTPIIVEANGRIDLVLAMPGEVWGLNPTTGGLRWYSIVPGSDSARASVTAHGDLVVAMASGRGATSSIAVRAGGKGEVEPLWTGRDNSDTSTPVIHNGRLYIVKDKVVSVVDIESGKRITQTRLSGQRDTAPDTRSGRGRGGRDYSSPIVAGNRLHYTSRSGDSFVLALSDKPEQIAHNRFDSDESDFNSTPAISGGEIFMRSSKAIYCIAAD